MRKYMMVTGPMGAGKSTFMRSLPKPWGNFVVPNGVPDMLLDYACNLKILCFMKSMHQPLQVKFG